MGAVGARERYGRYADPGGVADMVIAALVINAVVSLLVTGFAISYLSALAGAAPGAFGVQADIQAASHRLDVGDGISFWAWVICAVVFVVWTHRTYRNLGPLGATGLRFRSGWAIGAWFVPVLAIWRPKQILGDTWRASDRDLPPGASRRDWGSRRTPALMAAWWVLWVAGALAERLTFQIGDQTLASARATLAIRVAGGLCLAAAAVLGVWVVSMITRRQRERAERLRELGVLDDPAGAAMLAPERPVVA